MGDSRSVSSKRFVSFYLALLLTILAMTLNLATRSNNENILTVNDLMLNADGSDSMLSFSTSYISLVDYSDVLLIRNLNSIASMTIADYFRLQRNISWSHICNVTTSTTETIDSATFDALATQVKSCIASLPPSTVINFLVTTKGIPLRTWRYPGETYASVDSELALVGGVFEGSIGGHRWIVNPYFNDSVPFSKSVYDFYIVTRLTAFTVPEVIGIIDNATIAIGRKGRFVLDVDPGKDGGGYQVGNDWMRVAAMILSARGFDVTLDQTNTFLTKYSDVAGYFSWGSNDGTWTTPLNSNVGFETDGDLDGVPDGWFYDDPSGTANITRNTTVVQSGLYSLRIERPSVDSNYTSVSINASILPDRRYFVAGGLNFTNVSGGRGLFLQLKVYDAMDNLLLTKNGSALTGSALWRGFLQVIHEPIENATRATISVFFAEANGTAFIDNVRLIEIRPDNTWVPGSIAETAVSTGGRSFTYGTSYGQSLIADLIMDGVTGVKGYVFEPYLNAVAHADILFDAYTNGYTLSESYMMASQLALSWQDTIVGDPKLAPYNLSYIPDLAVEINDIEFSNPYPGPNETIDFDVAVHNIGHFPATNTTVSFYLGDPGSGGTIFTNRTVDVIDGSYTIASIQFNTSGLDGWHDMCVVADSLDRFYELNESNNIACRKLGVTTTYTVRIPAGHRFVSFPLFPMNDSIESVLASMSGCFDYVRWFDSSDATSPWKSYMPGRAYNSLLHLDNTIGFWINMTTDCNLVITGIRPTVTLIVLNPGWNMVGFPSFQTTYTVTDFKTSLGLAGVRVEVFDKGADPFLLQRAGDGYVMSYGEGYWVYVPLKVTWMVQG